MATRSLFTTWLRIEIRATNEKTASSGHTWDSNPRSLRYLNIKKTKQGLCTLNADFYPHVKDHDKYHYCVQKVVIYTQMHWLTIDDAL